MDITFLLDEVAEALRQSRVMGSLSDSLFLTALRQHAITGLDLAAVGRITRTLWLDHRQDARGRKELMERLARVLANIEFDANDFDGKALGAAMRTAGVKGYVIKTSELASLNREPRPDHWGIATAEFYFGGRDDHDPEDGLP